MARNRFREVSTDRSTTLPRGAQYVGMPRLVSAPVTVVEDKNVKVNEFFGGASCNPCGDISFAHVTAQAGWAEDWQTPAFDEYVLVLKGKVSIEHAHGPTVEVGAGQAVYLHKGERVRWVFNEPAEYVPICLPAFSPSNIHREETGDNPPPHDAHFDIYHLVQTPLWEAAKTSGETYFPPSYAADGLTHATADPAKLLMVANHFYKDVIAEWLCLRMTRATLASAGATLKFEEPVPVGTTPSLSQKQSGGERFPHIFGGISPAMVVEEYVVHRAADGTYTAIEGLC